MIISRTPFRVSLFGGGTDYPAYFKEHGGQVLGGSINKYCYISARYLPPHFTHKSRIVYSKEEWVNNNADIEHPAVRECLRYLGIFRGVEICHQSDMLARRGMGSSSAFTVGLLHALRAFTDDYIGKDRLAQQAIIVEQDWIKENVGCQDQYLCAMGGLNHVAFSPNGSVQVSPIANAPWLEPYLMLFGTNTTRIASDIAKTQIAQIPQKQKELREMYAMVDEAIKLVKDGKAEELGLLLHQNWQLKKTLSDKITLPELDAIYEEAMKAGAWGGKLLGAGGGGHMLFVVAPEKQGEVAKALAGLRLVPFRFEYSGSQIIFKDDETKEKTGWGEERHSG